jgi:hypothetical protein
MQFSGFTREPKPSDVIRDCVERADLPECLKHALRLCALGVNELAT